MAIRQLLLPRPAVGTDWAFTVPAQWAPYLYGVTATLTTVSASTTIPDETANNHPMTIQSANGAYVGAQPGPFAGGANNYSVLGPDTFTGFNGEYAITAQSTAFGLATFTYAGWVKMSATETSPSFNTLCAITNLGGGDIATLSATPMNTATPSNQIWASSGTNFSDGPWMSRGAWHHFACTWDGAQWVFYRDGASIITHVGANPNGIAGSNTRFAGGGGERGALFGNEAAVGVWSGALTGANIATLAAASGSWSAYRTAALALTPVGLWGLGIPATGPSRIATLKVTDGTRTVAQFPANFTATTATSFVWSWQALGPGAQSSTDGQINSVPIPELALDAGYVISASTLDLAGTDQWGPITLWFDDGTGTPGSGGTVPGGYLNALLVPDYSHQGG